MGVWIWLGTICLVMGVLLGLIENWARGEAIPHWRILGIAVSVSVISRLLTFMWSRRPIFHIPAVLTIAALMLDRLSDRMKQGL